MKGGREGEGNARESRGGGGGRGEGAGEGRGLSSPRPRPEAPRPVPAGPLGSGVGDAHRTAPRGARGKTARLEGEREGQVSRRPGEAAERPRPAVRAHSAHAALSPASGAALGLLFRFPLPRRPPPASVAATGDQPATGVSLSHRTGGAAPAPLTRQGAAPHPGPGTMEGRKPGGPADPEVPVWGVETAPRAVPLNPGSASRCWTGRRREKPGSQAEAESVSAPCSRRAWPGLSSPRLMKKGRKG